LGRIYPFGKKLYIRNMYHDFFIGVDPGNEKCGMTVLQRGCIIGAWNLEHPNFYRKISYFLTLGCKIAIEDLKPYSVRLTPQVIDTAKFIGECVYRLRIDCGATVEMVNRSAVKKWVFDTFPEICVPLIMKKIAKKGQRIASTGEFRRPSFVYVDDKIIVEAMKFHYKIPKPPPGNGYMYGLKEHSWQALALASLYYSGCHKFVTK
ncbi:MAG TPA: hypothetical protein PKV73_16605, partial [Agriterribacter sp.]|nr:hypothetical protein [Agriterribacter sp.]